MGLLLGSLRSPRALLALGTALAAVIVLATLPPVIGRYYTLVIYQMLVLVGLAQAWNILAGYGGLVSLAPAVSVGMGSYAAAVVGGHLGWPLPLLILSGGVVAALFAVVVSVPMFRFRGLYFAIATLVLSQAVYVFMINWNGLGGTTGLFLTEYIVTIQTLYYYALGLAVFATVTVFVVLRTRLGLSLRALRDDEDTAQEMGVSTFRTKLWVWVLSSFLIGMVGALEAARLSVVTPDGALAITWTINIVTTTIVGGVGTIVGPVIGSVFTVWLAESLADYPELHVLITGLIVILIIRFAPAGIWGVAKSIAGRIMSGRKPAAPETAQAEAAPLELTAEQRSASSAAATRMAATVKDGPAEPSAMETVLLSCAGLTKRYGDVVAAAEIDLAVSRGEVLGVIGPNGAGKSTLMKMLARVLPPTEGRVVVRGTVAPMIELGAGFSMELTAYENIVMYGTLLGRQPEFMRERAAEIAHWASLDEFLDVPLRSYSSGMLARLGFSVATDTEPDVLIVDEVLSVGDAAFQQKSAERMRRMIEDGASVVLVSHNLGTVLEIADRAIWLDRGLVKLEGDPREVVAAYQASVG